jgi:putative flippase GtrA
MTDKGMARREGVLGAKYAAVSLIGFATDAVLLHFIIAAGLESAWARLISLAVAMQVTFLINGVTVFHRLERSRWLRQWASYMASNGFGNFCNYWIFVTLVSLHWPVVSQPMCALPVGAFVAWMMNYASTRFWVFGKVRRSSRGPPSVP